MADVQHSKMRPREPIFVLAVKFLAFLFVGLILTGVFSTALAFGCMRILLPVSAVLGSEPMLQLVNCVCLPLGALGAFEMLRRVWQGKS